VSVPLYPKQYYTICYDPGVVSIVCEGLVFDSNVIPRI